MSPAWTTSPAVIASDILEKSKYNALRTERYASFDSGSSADFEAGQLSLEALADLGAAGGEPAQTSGKQELYEMIVNQYI